MKKVVWVLLQRTKESFTYIFVSKLKMKTLIHSITFVFMLGTITQFNYAQAQSSTTDEELQKLTPDLQNKVVYRSQLKPAPSSVSLIVSQSSKQNVDSDYSVEEATNRLIQKANDFRYTLSRGDKLESFMSDSWSFDHRIYHWRIHYCPDVQGNNRV